MLYLTLHHHKVAISRHFKLKKPDLTRKTIHIIYEPVVGSGKCVEFTGWPDIRYSMMHNIHSGAFGHLTEKVFHKVFTHMKLPCLCMN